MNTINKKIKKNKKIYLQNKTKVSELKTYLKKIKQLIVNKETELATAQYKIVMSKIDKCATKNLIHKNKASRYKKRLNKKLKNIT